MTITPSPECNYMEAAKMVRKDGMLLNRLAARLRADRKIVRAAVRQSWRALDYAAPKFLTDRGMLLLAVAQDGLAISHAAQEMRDDSGVVSAAVQQNWRALQYASSDLRADRDIVLAAA